MTYPKAIVLSAALIAAAIAFAAYQPAQSALGSSDGRYMLAAGSENAWAIDTKTGEIRLCRVMFNDPLGIRPKTEQRQASICVAAQKKW